MDQHGYSRKRNCTYRLFFHLVFLTKGAKPLINEDSGPFIIERSRELFAIWNGEVIEGKYFPEYVDLFVSFDPGFEISSSVRSLKLQLSIDLKKHFPDIFGKEYPDTGVWTSSYFLSSTGPDDVSNDISKYIDWIKTKRKRGRPKKKVE